MGRYLQPGHEYTDGQTITGPSLTEHVGDAVLKPTTISEQLLKDPASATDELLINDGGVFKKITLQVLKELVISSTGLSSEDLSDEARIPPGVIMDYAGTAAPEGWLLCYGQTILRDDPYDRLFDAIGTTYGAGDGSTTFRLPDCRGRVAAGRDNMGGTAAGRMSDSGLVGHGVVGTTLGGGGGAQSHTVTVAEMPSHTHAFTDYYEHLVLPGVGVNAGSNFGQDPGSVAGVTAAAGGNTRHNNVQPTIIFNKIIRYL